MKIKIKFSIRPINNAYLFSCWNDQSYKRSIKEQAIICRRTLSWVNIAFSKHGFQQAGAQTLGKLLNREFKNTLAMCTFILDCFNPEWSFSSQIIKFFMNFSYLCNWHSMFKGQELKSMLLIASAAFSLAERHAFFRKSSLLGVCIHNQVRKLSKFSDKKREFLDRLRKERELDIFRRKIITVPNILTLSRLASAPLFPWLISNQKPAYAFSLLVYCGITDMVHVCS